MAEDKVTKLYNTFVKNGYAMESEAQFRENLKDAKKRKATYDALVADGYDMEPYATFETNIGFGKPAQQPAQQQAAQPAQAQPAAAPAHASTDTATAEAATPATPQQPAQPAWQPTEQEKIQMSWQLHQMNQQFQQNTQAIMDKAKRVSERNTPEGRRKLKAAEWSARAAGLDTRLMGLTPPSQIPQGESADGQTTQDAKPQPLPTQSPVPYGVKIENGKRVVEWLMPDGSLTTNLIEADKGEYMARQGRLQHQFVNRMKANGLDPANPEDVQRQAQLDYEAPMRRALEREWSRAEAEDKSADEEYNRQVKEYNSSFRSNVRAFGPDGMPLATPEENVRDYNQAVQRKETFNLETIANNVLRNLPASYRDSQIEAYTQYFNQHPDELNGRSVATASQQALQAEVYNAVHERAVQWQMPKSKTEFFIRKIADQPFIPKQGVAGFNVTAASMTGSWGEHIAEMEAMSRFGQQHRGLDIVGTIVNMAVDPTTYISGGVGSFVGKQAIKGAGQVMLKEATKEVAERYAARTLTGRVIGGMAGGAANFATFEALKDVQSQIYLGGVVNPETHQSEGFSFDSVLASTGHGLLIGSATGMVAPLIGNVADKAVMATTSTAGKVGVRASEVAVSTLAEGTIFSIPEWIHPQDPNKSAWDVWTDNMAMMAGFKVSHGIKSAPRIIRELKAGGKRYGLSFEERLRRQMEVSPRSADFSKEELAELRQGGYGELADLFKRDDTQTPVMEQTGDGSWRVTSIKAEEVGRDAAFDGYDAMERLMQDNNISEAARAKAYYILTGRHLPQSTVMAYAIHEAEDGSVVVESKSAQGSVITRRSFKNREAAQGEIDTVARQMELNSVEIGERYKESEANSRMMDAAFDEAAAEFGTTRDAMRNIYQRSMRGDVELSDGEFAVAQRINEAIERNKGIADSDRPEAIRARIKEESGHDVDEILRKQPKDRTEAEQAVIDDYVAELYPERDYESEARYEAAQQEANAIHDASRLLYDRYEQADPDAQAEIDAIYLRYEEAHNDLADRLDEATFSEVQENPWAFLTDPDMAEHEDALLYYINSRTAYEGVMQAHAEGMENKRAAIVHSIESRTHKDSGMIVPATIKVEDRPVYIVKGDVQMFPDGTAVDVRNSSESVVICDAESGEFKMVSPDAIFKVGTPLDAQEQLATALAALDAEPSPFDNMAGVDLTAPHDEGEEQRRAQEGAAPADKPADAPAASPDAPAATPADTAAYDKGYEDGIEAVSHLDDASLNSAIEDLRGRESLTDEWRGRLEAYEYEQQRRAQEGVAPADKPADAVEQPLTPAEAPAEKAPQGTALSRIPVEGDEPQFTKVDAETGWDGLVEMARGDEKRALPIAQQQLADARTRLDKLNKKPPTLQTPKLSGKSVTAQIKEQDRVDETNAKAMAEYEAAKAQAQSDIDAWSRILGVYNSRNAEARAAAEAERQAANAAAHDAAVARFEEEQRIKAEKEAEQAAIGTHAVNPKIKAKWDNAPKVEGHSDAITLPDGSTIRGRYILTEAGATSASHDVNNAYAPTEGFPIDENGQSVNDRDYQRDTDAQRIVEDMAGAFDNRALQSPIIVSKDGVVLSGNNRTMSGDLAAVQGTDEAYVDYLREFSHKYGFTPEQVGAMQHPRVVFVPDEAMAYDATTFARFNAQEMKSQSKPEAAVKLGKVVPEEVFNNIVANIARYDRLSDYYADERAVAQALGALQAAGVINDKQMPELRTGTQLSAAGKELLENTLIGKTFQSSPDAVRDIIATPTLRQSIVMGLSEIVANRTLAKSGYDLSAELAKAVDLVARAKNAMPDIYVEGVPVSPFGRMQGLFDDEFGDSRVTDGVALLLADALNSGKPSDLRKFLLSYNSNATQSAAGQMDIFSGGVIPKEQILTEAINHFRNATPKEQQALVEKLIADRKQRAEAEGQRAGGEGLEQTPNGTGGSAEPARVEPTEAQKAAGNYKKKHVRVDGHEISIENEKGTVRRGKDADGKEWATEMHNDYGYIRGTKGVDGDHIDVYLSDTPERGDVFVVDQYNPDGTFDEHKVMYGFPTEEAARSAYLSNYKEGWENGRRLDITHVSKDEFDKWIESSKRKTKPFAEYKSVKPATDESIEPTGYSDFGPVFTQFKGDAQGAIKKLTELKAGEAIGALHHKDVGDIDLVWGIEGTGHSDGMGLAKLVKYHPEVVEHLQEILDDMHVVSRSENRVNLESDTHKAGVRLTWNNEKKKWLLTAFEKKETPKSIVKTTDTGENPADLRGDTALSQNSGVSGDKVSTLSQNKQESGIESSAAQRAWHGTEAEMPATPGLSPLRRSVLFENAVEAYKEGKGEASTYTAIMDGKEFGYNEFEAIYRDNTQNTTYEKTLPFLPAVYEYLNNRFNAALKSTRPKVQDVLAMQKEAYQAEVNKEPKWLRKLTTNAHERISPEDGVTIGDLAKYIDEYRNGWQPPMKWEDFLAKVNRGEVSKEEAEEIVPKYARHFMLRDIADQLEMAKSAEEHKNEPQGLEDEWGDCSITPTKYTNKAGKTSDVFLLKVGRELTPAEQRAVDAFVKAPLAEGRKTSRGWYDRKQGGYMMRSLDAAKGLEKIINDPEAMADAQPLSREDIAKAASPVDKPAGAAAEKSRPANKVESIDELDKYWYTKGRTLSQSLKEADLPAHYMDDMPDLEVGKTYPTEEGTIEVLALRGAEVTVQYRKGGEGRGQRMCEPCAVVGRMIVEPKQDTTEKGKLTITDSMKAEEDILRDLLGIDDDEVSDDVKFRDPGELTPEQKRKVYAAGVNYALGYFDQNITAFPDFAAAMVGRLGAKIKPWLKSFYEGAKRIPGYDESQFTPSEEVDRFDVANFDKPSADMIAAAETRLAERKAEAASQEAEQSIIEQRNQQRKEEDDKTTAGTVALAEEAGAVASEAKRDAGNASEEKLKKIDKVLDKVNERLALLGHYESGEGTATAEQRALQDATILAFELCQDLGLDEKALPQGVDFIKSNFHKMGGFVELNLPIRKDLKPIGVTIRFDRKDSAMQVSDITLTKHMGGPTAYIIGAHHTVMRGNTSYSELLGEIRKQFADELKNKKVSASSQGSVADVLPKEDVFAAADRVVAETKGKKKPQQQQSASSPEGQDLTTSSATDAETVPNKKSPDKKGWVLEPTSILSVSSDGTKVTIPKETAKENLEIVKANFLGERKAKGFIASLSIALGSKDGENKQSFYYDFVGNDGKAKTLRLSNHNVNAANVEGKHPEISIVVKSRRQPNRFHPSGEAEVTEYVYFKEDIASGDGQTLGWIAHDIANMLDTGKYADTSGMAVVNRSPEGEPSLRSSDNQEAKAAAVNLLKGGKKGGKSKKKSVTLQPDEPLGGLFADINDEAPNGTDINPTGQAVAGTKRTHSVGADAPRTDGGNEPDQVAGTRSAGDAPAKRQGVERGTDAEAHGTDADGGLQPVVGNRGRNESGTDSRGAGRTDVSAGTARPGVDAGRETDRGGERLPAGEPAAETGNGGRLPSVSSSALPLGHAKKPKKPEVKYTRNFRYDESGNDADNFTPAQRLEANVKAVETIAEVLLSGKPATEEQKKIMSQFRGWGQVDLGKYYDIDHILRNAYHNTPIYRLAQAIQKLDPNGEKKLFAAIKRASLSSYYTPTPIARAMNTFLGLAGYKGGSLLDPSMGNGMFEGTLPKSIQERTAITGVELDWLSGQLSRALYPDANIIIDGFEKSGIAPGSFDVVTSNVPFGDIVVNDPSWKNDSSPLKRSAQNRIHNYYAVKMLEAARPGGLVAMMTTSAVMDTKSNQNIRAHIADQGEILGAIRLPDNTFQGTGVVTDIIFVRKWRDEQDRATTREDAGYMELERAFLSHTETTAPNKLDGSKQKVQHNAYYELNRRNMIGDIQAGDQYGKKDAFGLTSKLSVDEIANEVEKAIKRIVGTRRGSIFNPTRTVREARQAVREAYKGEGDWVSNGNLVIQDGKVGTLTAKSNEYGETTRTFEGMLKHDKMLPRVTSMIDVRTAMKKLIAGQIDDSYLPSSSQGSVEGEKESTLKRLREELQTAYDAFVKKYGRLRDKDNAFILDDIDGYTLQALEVWKSGKFVGLSDIFTKNSIKPALKLDGPKLPQEAVALSLAEYGYLRPDYMAKTLGENWAEQCGDLVFLKPNSEDDYVTREEYLSGDVVTKLAEARAAAEKDLAFERNVKALEEVQPARIPFDDIAIHLGARWIPGEVYTDFMHDIFGLHATARGRHYDRELGRMVEDFKSGIRYIPELDTFDINVEKKELGGQASDWETPKKSAKEILQAALEDKNVIIKYKDKEGNEHVDEEQTELANQKIADLREKFESWLSVDPQRVEMLEDAYNARFNRTVIRHFDGSHLVVPGLMGKELRPHQKDAVWMLINNRGGIVDHIVGAGKTLVMQSAIMEMRRMGIAKKPMIVALKSTVSQIAREFKEAFPSARVLAPNDTDFQKENRKKFIANISLNDYDCIILSHEQYCMLPHTEEAERAVIDEQMWQLDNMIDYLYGVDDQSQMTKKQIKALEKRRENLKARLEQRLDRNVDREFCFENLGIDYMFVDESHQFKSLPYVTSYQRVAGLGSTDGSSRAIALLTGIRHLQRMHQGDMGTVFLSGTTITNSLVEIYNILNYLRPRKLEELGMPTFDAWASTFAVHSSELEAGVSGNFAMKDRFRSFDNVPELSQLYAEIADVRNDSNLKLPKPAIDARNVIVPASEAMQEINAQIVYMLEHKDGSYFGKHVTDPRKAPWGLWAADLSAKAAVSPRLIFPDMEDDGGKVHAVCENVKKYYDEQAEQKGVQLIFCEIGVPGKDKAYDAYTDMINRFVNDYGIPRSEIAYIQEAPNEEKRKELFQKVRDGQVRILIGGTKNMGTGVNVQDRITDMHMLTVPWTPSALEQCVGRGARQGNIVARDFMGNKVRVHYYATEGSLDLYKYQLLDAKGKMFTQFKMGTVNGGRSFDEGSADEEGGMDPAEMVAILSGNPVIFERAKQEKAVKKLRALRNGFERDYQRKKAKAEELTRRQENFERLVRLNDRDRAELERAGFVADEKGNYPFLFNISSGSYYDKGRTFDKPKEAGEYLLQLIKDGTDPVINAFGKRIKVVTVNEEKEDLFASHKELQIGDGDRFSIRYSVRLSDDATAAGMGLRNLLKKIVDNRAVYARELEETKTQLSGLNVGDGVFSRQKELDEAVAKLKELNAEYNKLGKTSEQESTKHRLRTTEPPKNTGIGYKVFVLKDGKLYPPMVANADRAETPTGVWLDADANEQFIIGGKEAVDAQYSHVEPWLRRYQVAAGGKGTQGGSGALAYRPGWHLGEIPYALQFSRKNPATGERDQFPAEFVWARVEYAKDVDYQQESDDRMWYDKDGKKSRAPRHALGGLNHVPENGSYTYRTNPNPETDPWIITGSMRVIEIVKPSEVDELVRAAGREPQQRQAGAVTDEQVEALNRDLQKRMNTNAEAMEGRALELAAKLNTGINVVRTQEEADALPTPVYRRSKGWFDPNARDGENAVTVVIPNNANVADVEFTVLHEVAGHKGLRRLVGEDKMNDFLDEMYGHMPKSYVDEVQAREQKMFDAEVDRLTREKGGGVFAAAEAHVEARGKREQFRRDATEEFLCDKSGEIGDEGFEKMDAEEQTFWGKIKSKVQKLLDNLLKGIKWAKSIRLSEKDVAYILYRSWKGMRAERSAFTAAEDAVMRRKTGWDADVQVRFRDPDMGLEETITRMKAEAMQANADNLQAKRDAMRAIGGNLNHLRQAMARQREYDITTVKSVADLARVLMDAGLLDDMSKNETKRILGAIDNVVGRQDVSKYVQKVMDIMVDSQLRTGANAFGKLVSIRGSRVDARGIEVQGELDPEGQAIAKVVRKGITLTKDDIEQRMADAIDRMSSSDTAIADEAAIEYAGLQIAHQYAEEITESKAEEKALRESIREAKADHDAGQMDDAAYKQYVAATEDAIRQNKIERAEAYHSLIERMGDALSASIERAKAWREAEKQRVQDIHHNANSDMEGRPTDEHHKNDRAQKLANNSGVRFLLAPLGTFDQMLRMFGQKNVRGEGYLWNRFMRGWEEASEREYTGYRDALKELDAKVEEVFSPSTNRLTHGRGVGSRIKKWGDLFSIDRKLPKASVRFWDGGEMKDHELTQGNLLYIYMADKMLDGRMKLRKMGITEDDIDNIKNFLDPRFIELADWMQEEYLVGKRNEYNEVHKRMFGASMAAIENYFPLKILANARIEEVDIADDTTDTALPATSTGSIIKRRRNNLALDVTGANAFSVILDHLQQMERWAAFAEFNRDLNTLLSYKRFRNQVMNMSSVYGGGKVLWNNFRNVCSMAAGAYRPPIAALDKAAVNIAKGVTAAKVSFRVFTALKQLLSMPAYISDCNPVHLATNLINPVGAWGWCMDNLPLFEKRWKSRMAGDPRLLKSEMDWKMWRSQAVQMASRVGMSPNAFVDALTVAIGTEAMYKTKLKKYLRQGYEQAVAEKKAKQDATILFNQTQQSSEGAFLSTMQVDRSWLSVLFTVFRNSPMSYTRQLYDAIRNQKHHFERGYKERSIEFMTKQFVRDGIDPDQARKNAEQEYRRSTQRDLARIGVFGFALQFAWNLGAYLPYLILGDDDEEKDKMMDDVLKHSYFGSIEGLTGGDVMSAAGQMALNGDDNYSSQGRSDKSMTYLVKDMPLASDITTILKKWPKDKVDAMNDVVNLLGQSALGVNPQSFTDAVVAVMDYCGDDANTSRECALLIARVINCPQSQLDKIYFDELGASGEEASQMTPAEIAERYAEYKTMRNAPLTGWAYSDAARDSVMTSHSNKALKIISHSVDELKVAKGKVEGRMATEATRQLLAEYDEVTQAESDLSKKKKAKDFAGYREGKKALREQHDMRVHNRVKRYKRDMKELTEQYLQSTDPQEADSLMRTMEACRAKMLEDVQGYTCDKPAGAAQ